MAWTTYYVFYCSANHRGLDWVMCEYFSSSIVSMAEDELLYCLYCWRTFFTRRVISSHILFVITAYPSVV